MKLAITYAPKNGEEKAFVLDPDDVDADEAELIEGAGGEQWDSYGMWIYQLNRGGFRAVRVGLWMLLRRTNPNLDLNEVKPRVSEMRVRPPDDGEDDEDIKPPESAEGKSETGDESTSSP